MALSTKIQEVKGSYRVTTRAFRRYLTTYYTIGGGVSRVEVRKRYWLFGWRWRWASCSAQHIRLDLGLFSKDFSFLYEADKDCYDASRCMNRVLSTASNEGIPLSTIKEQGVTVTAKTEVGGQTFTHRVGAGSYSE